MTTERTDRPGTDDRPAVLPAGAARSARRRTVAYAMVCALVGGGLQLLFSGPLVANAAGSPIVGAYFLVVCLVGVALMARAATSSRLPAAARRPWRFMICAELALTGTGVIAHSVPAQAMGGYATIGISVIGRVILVAFNLSGLFAFAAEPMSPRDRLKLMMDVGTVSGASLMLSWYALIGPVISDRSGLTHVPLVALVLPVADLIMLTGVFTVMMRGAVPAVRRPLRLLLAASAVLVLSSTFEARELLSASESPWFAPVLAVVATALLGCAAFEQLSCARDPRSTPAPAAGSRTMEQRNHGVPYLALVFGYGLLMLAAIRSGSAWWPGLVVGAVLMTATVAGRQAAVLQENRELVVTDRLTGLSNRYPLTPAIERATVRSRRSGTPMAVLLFDLDGFKQVNDTMGHEAGDHMLVGFAEVLRSSIRPVDLAARLGGDEFAVILEEVTTDQAVSVAQRIHASAAAGSAVGTGTGPIRCSIGIAIGDPIHHDGIPSPADLLAHADAAMYEAKRAGEHGWKVAGGSSGPSPSLSGAPAPRPASGRGHVGDDLEAEVEALGADRAGGAR